MVCIIVLKCLFGNKVYDIQVVVDEVPHDKFVRSEKDVIYNLLLSFPQAALGCTIDVPTITGKARINIEPGTQPGKVLRLKGKGIPAIKEYDRQCGDEVIKISVNSITTLFWI